MSDLYIILLFSNALDTSPCSSSFCKYKTANSSKISYTSFKTYQGKKLGVTTLIRKISVSSFYFCITNCSKDSNCSSVNYNQVSKEENCELLSENAYENRTDLKHFQGWKHATTYVSILWYTFYCVFIPKFCTSMNYEDVCVVLDNSYS